MLLQSNILFLLRHNIASHIKLLHCFKNSVPLLKKMAGYVPSYAADLTYVYVYTDLSLCLIKTIKNAQLRFRDKKMFCFD